MTTNWAQKILEKKQSVVILMGESTDLGNTFWQAHLAKNKKMYLGRGLVKPSTEVLTPRPRFYEALNRGVFHPSVEVWTSVKVHTSTEVLLSKKIIKRGHGGPGRHFQSLDRGTVSSTEEQQPSPQSNPSTSK